MKKYEQHTLTTKHLSFVVTNITIN